VCWAIPTTASLSGEFRWMFWTDWGREAKIERCGMDGSQRSVVVGDDVTWPNSVAIDDRLQRLYWTDAGLHRIETSRLDGSHRKVHTGVAASCGLVVESLGQGRRSRRIMGDIKEDWKKTEAFL